MCRGCVSTTLMITQDEEEDVLFKSAVRLGSGKASDVALEGLRVFTFTTQQAAGWRLSAVQEHTEE